MNATHTSFTPTEHGFRFPNSFQFKSGLACTLPLAGRLDLDRLVFGLCGGMCFAALDYFQAGTPLAPVQQVDQLERPLFVYLVQRQLDSLSLPVVAKIAAWMLLDPPAIARKMTRTELPRLRQRLEQGKPQVLCLIRTHGLTDPTRNHQVLATGYEQDPQTRALRIFIYDPNHPGQSPFITVDPAHAGQPGWLAQSTREADPLYGLFLIPYRVSKTAPAAAPAEPAAAGPVALTRLAVSEPTRAGEVRLASAAPAASAAAPVGIRLSWPVDSTRINQRFGENPAAYRAFGLPGHEGIDLYALHGAAVYAAAAGVVYQVEHPANHPYGLQVRIRHELDGEVFHTIYAHLAEASVKNGQSVRAGQLIGRADNTGNSFGDHLHLTLKIDGRQTPGYPAGIVDPLPYLLAPDGQADGAVYTTHDLNLRSAPTVDAQVLSVLPAGEALTLLDDPAAGLAAVGQVGQWLHVRSAAGQSGYVAAWYTARLAGEPFPPTELVVYPSDALNLRSGPGLSYDVVAVLPITAPLTVLGDEATARARLGKQGQWLQVQTGAGQRGFVAAWLVHLTGQPAPATGLAVTPLYVINVRARPALDANVLSTALPGDRLAVLGDRAAAEAALGKQDAWLNVRLPGGLSGYAAAWLLQACPTTSSATRAAAVPSATPASELSVRSTAPLTLHAQPSPNSPRTGSARPGQTLAVIQPDLDEARATLGQAGQWLRVATPGGARGWAPAGQLEEA